MRCERNLAGPEEDCGRHIAYTACGKPAHWTIESQGFSGYGWQACEEHALEVLRESSCEVLSADGDPMVIGDDGELVFA